MGGLAARKNVGGMQLLRSSFRGRKYVVCRVGWVDIGELREMWREWQILDGMEECGKLPGQNAKFYQSDGKIKPLPKEWQYFTW